ncbi:Putative 12-oxophytodienoate reductase 3 [Cytospora mali]|uniref:12-oxophytodienoate reductase 3 n=1 Tax=Cytospora mali TaxID=578113 RepID=A0A194V163_CYTMA|nr:Putative 12-oxophytodienoate reductase 3 [Valsa mali var. pyri (nom. inval.)]
MGDSAVERSASKLFQPLDIGNGKIKLKHRVVLAPLTRNRGTPVKPSTPEDPNREWVPNDLMVEYYTQRATDGGLIISEAIPPNLEGNAMPGVPGLFREDQAAGWKKVVDAVHAKGGFIYAQLWHSGRANLPQLTGTPTLCPSATPWDDPNEVFAYPPPHSSTQLKLAENPPLHAGNGYLPEQFLSSNINKRTDAYGGSPERRCAFVLELMDALAAEVGQDSLAIRLSPFGLFNQARGEQRLETWGHLSRELKRKLPLLSYVSFIEPRYEQIFSEAEKQAFLGSWGLADVDLSEFRKIFGDTPFLTGGGWDDTNAWGVLETGKYDAMLFGRYFISNPDLVERLRKGLPLAPYDRSRFYGPFPDPHVKYTDYPTWEQQQKEEGELSKKQPQM